MEGSSEMVGARKGADRSYPFNSTLPIYGVIAFVKC